jgi:hypothetical protein
MFKFDDRPRFTPTPQDPEGWGPRPDSYSHPYFRQLDYAGDWHRGDDHLYFEDTEQNECYRIVRCKAGYRPEWARWPAGDWAPVLSDADAVFPTEEAAFRALCTAYDERSARSDVRRAQGSLAAIGYRLQDATLVRLESPAAEETGGGS